MNALLEVEQPLSTRNTPAGGQFRVYVPVPEKFLCFPGTESSLSDNFAVLSPSFPNQPACRQCPSGHRAPEKLPTLVRTKPAPQGNHPDRVRHPPGSSATRRHRSGLPVVGRWQDTPRIASASAHSL